MRILLALFAALLLLSVGSGATASTSTSPQNGLIAVEGRDGIYIVDPRTGTARPIPKSSELGDPAWSPDGTRLAVTSFENDRFDIYTMKPDGSERTLVLRNAAFPSWSPEGKRLVVMRNTCGEGSCAAENATSLAIVNADGSNVRGLGLDGTEEALNVSAPEWSPDGKLIAFVDSGGSIQLISPDGKRVPMPVEAPIASVSASWSPDSSKLAFDRYEKAREVAVVLDLASGQETVLPGEEYGAAAPVWSPEGDQLVFSSLAVRTATEAGLDPLTAHLWAMAPDGTKAHGIVDGEYIGPASWARSVETEGASPADTEPEQQPLPAPATDTAPEPLPLPAPAPSEDAAPDVAKPSTVSTKRPAPSAATDGLIAVRGSDALYRTNPDGGSTQKIPDTSDMVAPAWSPDATLLAVERVGKGESSIWTIRPDGTDPQLVLPDASLPSWSPAGDEIYAVRNECGGSCEPEDEAANVLYSVRPDGKDVRRVEAGEDVDREFAWAPDGDAIGFFADENASDPALSTRRPRPGRRTGSGSRSSAPSVRSTTRPPLLLRHTASGSFPPMAARLGSW